jgi:hypothetical protein
MTTTDDQSNEPMAQRILGLIAKAESSEFPDEAQAFLAKAQQLMKRHAIDEALLDSRRTSGHDEVEADSVVCSAPYAGAKAYLLGVVAKANGVRVVVTAGPSSSQICTIVGFRSDLNSTTVLFTALSMHAARDSIAAEVPSFDTPRRFRHAFILAFAQRIGERLEAANATAQAEAEEAEGVDLAPVIQSREAKVAADLAARFPKLRTRRVSASSHAGAHSGSRSASRADIGQRSVKGSGRALGAG